MYYVEATRVQSHADKIAAQLDIVLAGKPQMYSKTKERYKQLAISLLSSVEKITTILELDSLASVDNKTSEFGMAQTDTSDLSDAIRQTLRTIDSYRSFVETDRVQPEVTNANKLTLRAFGQALELASSYQFKYLEVNECAFILNKWFKARFCSSADRSQFRYNIAYLPEWISSIIILYGKYHQQNKSEIFIDMMVAWSDGLSKSPNNWAVPYEVHQISKSTSPRDFTLDAVLIGDCLMDEVLYVLTESNSPDLVANLDCYPIASKVKSMNPALLPTIRTRLAKQDALARECNFRPIIGGA